MALIEKQIIDKVELTEINTIQVRTATIIEKDGTDPKVQAIANAIWTPEVIAAYQALVEANNTL